MLSKQSCYHCSSDDRDNSITDDFWADYNEMEDKLSDDDKVKLYKKRMEDIYYEANQEDSEPSFTDERITKLWSVVKRTNWTEDQRGSFLVSGETFRIEINFRSS